MTLAIPTYSTSGSNTATINKSSTLYGTGKIYVCPYPSSTIADTWDNTYSSTTPVSQNLYLTECYTIDGSGCYESGKTVTVTNSFTSSSKSAYCTVTNASGTTITDTENCTYVYEAMAYTNEWDCDVSFTMPSSNVTTSCVGGTADTTAPTATLTQATGSSVTATITDTNDITAYYFGTTSYSSGSDVPTDSWVSSTSKSLSLSITSSSTYYFYVKDEFNNISSQYSITPTYDVSGPTVSLTQATGNTVTATITDTSDVSAYYFGTTNYTSGSSVPSSSWTSSTSKSLTLSFSSSTTYYFYSKDKWGNISSSEYSIETTYDVAPPVISVSVSDGTTYATSKSATITISDTSGFNSTSDRVMYKWSTSTISSCPTSTSGWNSLTITTSGTSGSGRTLTISSETGGAGKIYVCPYPSSSYYPTDKWGNQATPSNTSPVSANFYLSAALKVSFTRGKYVSSHASGTTYFTNDGNNKDYKFTLKCNRPSSRYEYQFDTCAFTDLSGTSIDQNFSSSCSTDSSGVVSCGINIRNITTSMEVSCSCYRERIS